MIPLQAGTIMLDYRHHPAVLGVDACFVRSFGCLPQRIGQVVVIGQVELAAVAYHHRYGVANE